MIGRSAGGDHGGHDQIAEVGGGGGLLLGTLTLPRPRGPPSPSGPLGQRDQAWPWPMTAVRAAFCRWPNPGIPPPPVSSSNGFVYCRNRVMSGWMSILAVDRPAGSGRSRHRGLL